jgi:alpha-2-macroglobulin
MLPGMLRPSRLLVPALLLCCSIASAQKSPFDKVTPEWKEVERLAGEQKLEEASKVVAKIREAARKSSDDAELARALIEEVQLRIGLHGYETAVRYLRDEPWPKSGLPRLALNLYYAHALTTYANAYSWEIRQREKVSSSTTVDLKQWTADQIYAEAQRAWADVWAHRAELSKEPVGALGKFISANNYPSHIRGTLRDAVSYLAVELLSNSSHWRPEQSNDLFRLDWKLLLVGQPAQSARLKLDDPAAHPLTKLGAVLDDLEAWHKKEGRQEAALEARLTRISRLHAAFTGEEERAGMRKHLAELLGGYKTVPWWSMGMGRLAELVRADEGDLVRARQIALDGEKGHPGSHGAQLCRSIVAQIEAPDFQLASMSSDGLAKRSVQLMHKNLDKVYLRAYAVDLVQRVESAQDYNLLYSYDELRKLIAGSQPVHEWTEQLPATPDYKQHRTWVTPPLKKPSLYVIVASAKGDFRENNNRVMAVNMIAGDLVIHSRGDGAGGVVATVLSGASGKPQGGVDVALYRYDWGKRHSRVDTKRSDGEGQVRFGGSSGGRSYFLLALRGSEVALDSNSIYFNKPYEPSAVRNALIYTDRSVYRPQQKIFFKVIAYRGRQDLGKLEVAPGQSLTVFLKDPNNQIVDKKEVTSNTYGSASGEFVIPTGRLLGGWRLETSHGGYGPVRVEEYKRPTFEVSFKDAKDPLRLNRPATLIGEAKYYFGLPVASGAIKWRVTREAVYPWWWHYWGWGGTSSGTQMIATGVSPLDSDGTFKITFTPEVDEKKGKGLTYRYSVSADLTDEGGETRSASRSFRLGLVSVEASLSHEGGFLRTGNPSEMIIRRTNLDGAPRAGKGTWKVLALEQPKAAMPADMPIPERSDKPDQPKAFRTPGDALRQRWDHSYSAEGTIALWKDGGEKLSGSLTHGEDGLGKITLPSMPPGAYRIRYQTTDDFGATYDNWKEFIVAGSKTPLQLPSILKVEQSSVKVGQSARFLALGALPNQISFFEVYKNGKLASRKTLTAGSDSLIEVPVTEADRGGFVVLLTTVNDFQYISDQETVYVPWDNKQLDVSFSTFRDKIRPGAKEVFRVTVKTPNGKNAEAGAAELLAYMYDKSLDIFAPHHPPSPLALYPSRASIPWSHATLGAASPFWVYNRDFYTLPSGPSLTHDSLRFYDRYGIGGPGMRFGSSYRGGYKNGGGRLRRAEMDAPMAAAPAPPEPEAAPREAKKAKAEVATGAIAADEGERDDRAGNTRNREQSVQQPATQMRSNFAETAFFSPQLITDKDGSATVEFTTPDSVTGWNVWVHAVSRDLSSGSTTRETKSVKELMVRPYLPRFFREEDQAAVKVVVNNAGDKPLSGELTLEVIDPETQKVQTALFGIATTKQPFTVEAGKGANVTFPLTAPKQVGTYAFRVVASAGSYSDGELRPLPVLPSRWHLVQSRFVTLRDKDKRTMTFDDLKKNDDKTRVDDQMVVTVDAQLFYTVLKALPYLVTYPYECVEQTLNRFVSTGIVSSVYKKYPAVAKMAEEFGKRKTQLDTFDAPDPNRKMTLEESPWLEAAKGGADTGLPLVNVLDPRIAKAQRDEALGKLKKAQTSLGAFPWFPGGPPSPYMTLYLMHGFAKATEFQVEVPKDMVQRGWQYLARHFREEYTKHMIKDDCCWEFLTFLNYVASSYPDATWTGDALTLDERKKILDFSFKHWKKHSPYLKGYLALTLKRMGRDKDAQLVWASVMDSAKTAKDQGTFWAQEDRSWLWYNDTIETHAFALRVLMEVDPQNAKKDGLVLWLLLNKKLNQWKSTRATAEVIYSLVHYLAKEQSLGVKEEAIVTVGQRKQTFTFEPDKYVGKTQIVVAGPDIKPAESSTVTVEKSTKGFMFASATWHFSTAQLPKEDRGDFFHVSRKYFKRENDGKEWILKPLAEGAVLKSGDQVEVQVSLRTKHAAEYVHLRDPRAAGLEPENAVSRWKYDLGIAWYEETRDSGSNFFFEHLPVGEYTFKYRLRANMAGTFRVGPATVQSMYAPEFAAYSAGHLITVK